MESTQNDMPMNQHDTGASQDVVTHLIYRIADKYDIINRFSSKGNELLNDNFVLYLERILPLVVKDKPVVMQITGAELSQDEKNAVDAAVWSFYRLKISEASVVKRNCRIKTFWFLISFILSSILLFIAGSNTDEVLLQFFYLPFWFFGYRVITYPIFDYLPVVRECKKLVQMAAMHLMFTSEPVECVPEGEIKVAVEQKSLYERLAKDGTANNRMIEEFYMDGQSMVVECHVQGVEDIVCSASVPGRELLSASMASYLENVEPFVKKNTPVRLDIMGDKLVEEDKQAIQSAISHHYGLFVEAEQQAGAANWRKVFAFAVCLVIACVVLGVWGSSVSVATHELMLIVLWFFGDYLFEYALLEHIAIQRRKTKWHTISQMEINICREDATA